MKDEVKTLEYMRQHAKESCPEMWDQEVKHVLENGEPDMTLSENKERF